MKEKMIYIIPLLLFLSIFFLFSYEKNLLQAMIGAERASPEKETVLHTEDIEEVSRREEEKEEEEVEDKEIVERKETSKEEEEVIKDDMKEEVEINSSSKDDLERISGIGPAYAERIKEERPFCSFEEILEVKGIGEKTLESIKEQGLAHIEAPEKCKDEERTEGEEIKEKEEEERAGPVDINAASEERLQEIPGIGPTYAERIKEERPFCSFEEILEVKGIGEKTLEEVKKEAVLTIDDTTNCAPEKEKIREGTTRTSSEEELREVRGALEETEKEKRRIKEQRDRCAFSEQINVNTANKEKLEELPGIGPTYAKRIKEERKEDSFLFLEELQNIPGIGEVTVEDIINEGKACTIGDDVEIHPSQLEFEDEEDEEEIKIANNKKEAVRFEIRTDAEWLDIEKESGRTATMSTSTILATPVTDTQKDLFADIEVEAGTKSTKIPATMRGEAKDLRLSFKITDQEKEPLQNARIILEGTKKETNEEGRVTFKGIKDEVHSYKIRKEGYRTIEGRADPEDEKKRISLITKEEQRNLLKNWGFKEWDKESPLSWEVTHSNDIEVTTSTDGNLLDINHEYLERNVEQSTTKTSANLGDPDKAYGEVRIKGTGYVRTGIKAGQLTFSHSDWERLEDEDWTTIPYYRSTKQDSEEKWEFRIQTCRRGYEEEDEDGFEEGVELKVDAAYLSTREPPDDWHKE